MFYRSVSQGEYSIRVGAGGPSPRGVFPDLPGSYDGGDTVAFGVTARGGGGGGGDEQHSPHTEARPGGSGGGSIQLDGFMGGEPEVTRIVIPRAESSPTN